MPAPIKETDKSFQEIEVGFMTGYAPRLHRSYAQAIESIHATATISLPPESITALILLPEMCARRG